jgi:hypothetical protein
MEWADYLPGLAGRCAASLALVRSGLRCPVPGFVPAFRKLKSSTPDIRTDDMYDLTRPNGLGGLLELSEEMQIGRDFVAPHLDNDETKAELVEVLLMLQVAVNRHEDIKLSLSQDEQRAVTGALPAGLSNGFDRVSWERFRDSGVDALV